MFKQTIRNGDGKMKNEKETIVQVGREFYALIHLKHLSVDKKGEVDIKKFTNIMESYDVRLLKEVE